MDTAPAEAYAPSPRRHTAISDDIELCRLRVRESGGHYFADVVVAVPPGPGDGGGTGISDHIQAARPALAA
jgi:hypothetical protein